jgi:hypothetical protein
MKPIKRNDMGICIFFPFTDPFSLFFVSQGLLKCKEYFLFFERIHSDNDSKIKTADLYYKKWKQRENCGDE